MHRCDGAKKSIFTPADFTASNVRNMPVIVPGELEVLTATTLLDSF